MHNKKCVKCPSEAAATPVFETLGGKSGAGDRASCKEVK